MAHKPCRQLNSVAIRDELLAQIIPLVRSSCSIIGVKCVWRVQGGMAGIESAWSHITAKRNECDAVVSKIPGVALFFSAISTYQSAKRDNVLDSVQPSDEEDVVENQSLETTSSTLSSQVRLNKLLVDVLEICIFTFTLNFL